MDLHIVDVALSLDQSGEPRVNLGDVNTGAGYAAGAALWGAGDGFIGIPNGPDGSNQAPQALMLTQGFLRFCLATRDPRFVGKGGTLSEGDRAIVSACDASLFLSKSDNSIALKSTDMSVILDGTGGTITSSVGSAQAQVAADLVSLSIGGLGIGGTSVSISPTNITLRLGPLLLTMNGNAVSIVTQTGPPAELLVNLVPVTVP